MFYTITSKDPVEAVIYAYVRQPNSEEYELQRIDDCLQVVRLLSKCINGSETPRFTGELYYALVKGEHEGLYPLPLLFATPEERAKQAEEAGKPAPSETWVQAQRKKVFNLTRQAGTARVELSFYDEHNHGLPAAARYARDTAVAYYGSKGELSYTYTEVGNRLYDALQQEVGRRGILQALENLQVDLSWQEAGGEFEVPHGKDFHLKVYEEADDLKAVQLLFAACVAGEMAALEELDGENLTPFQVFVRDLKRSFMAFDS